LANWLGRALGLDSGADDLGPGHEHGPGELLSPFLFFVLIHFSFFCFAFYLLHKSFKQGQTSF
jgi:hypothetical protein